VAARLLLLGLLIADGSEVCKALDRDGVQGGTSATACFFPRQEVG